MFHAIGRYAATHPWIVCAVWVVVGGMLTLIAPTWDSRTQDDDVRFLPDRCLSVRGYQLMQQAFPDDVFASRLVFAIEREDAPLTSSDFALVKQLVADLDELRRDATELKVGRPCYFDDGIVGSRLVSNDKHCTLIQVPLGSPFLALQTQAAVDRTNTVLQKRLAEAGSAGLKLFASGSAGIGRDLVTAAGQSLDGTTWATIALVIVVLLLVYRAPLLAMVPLLTIAVSVWVAMELLALMTLLPGVHLVNISKIFAIVILYGAGTDYCLFLISRYREELAAGQPVPTALGLSVGAVGAALAASAGTVMCGLGLMGTAEFAKVRYAGPAIALSLGVALAASLTLTPALLRMAGKAVFWPNPAPKRRSPAWVSGTPRAEHAGDNGLWDRISHLVADYPIPTLIGAVLLLLPLAILGCNVQPNYRPTSELSATSDSVLGLAAIQRHFPVGETGPLTVLLTSSTDWTSLRGQAELDHLSRGFARLAGVAEVRSLTQPLGVPMPLLAAVGGPSGGLNGLIQQGRQAALAHYVSKVPRDGDVRHVTRVDLILTGDPFDASSVTTMQQVQFWVREELPRLTLLSDLQSEIFGVTANAHDLAQVTESDRVRVNVLILAGIFLILLLVVRRPGFALYLLVTVLFSYFATLGATRLAGALWTGHVLDQVDWRVPFFLFTILVAVGEDYNILLVTRALQERKRHGAREGMRRALAKTGGTITSCGLIVAGTFATLMLASLNPLKQIGFALAFGVLLDTFIVRPLLVPAFAMLFWSDEGRELPFKEDIILRQLAQYRKAS